MYSIRQYVFDREKNQGVSNQMEDIDLEDIKDQEINLLYEDNCKETDKYQFRQHM